MILYEDVSNDLIQKKDTWKAARDAWYVNAQRGEGYYYNDIEQTNTTYTQAQVQQIKQTTDVYPSINYLYPAINQKQAILAQNKPSHRVVAVDGSEQSKGFAYILDKIKNHVMYISESVEQQVESIKDMLVLGQGITGYFEKSFPEVGDFGIEYTTLHPSQVILDANSRNKTGKDMSGYFIEKEITEDDAKMLYQPLIDRINEKYKLDLNLETFQAGVLSSAMGRGNLETHEATTRRGSYYTCEYYYLLPTTMYYVKSPEGEIHKYFIENFDYEDETFILENTIEQEYNRFLCKVTILGNKVIEKRIIGIRNRFNIKVKYFEWGGSPYRSYGMTHFTMGMQDAYDKFIQMMIVNGMLTNNAGYISAKGAILEQDKVKWEKLGNKPGTVKEFNVIVDQTGKALIPEREQIQGLSNFYPMLLEVLRSGIDISTGVPPFMQGNPSEAKVEVFSSLQQYTNAAMQRINLALQHIMHTTEHEGNVLIDYILFKLTPGEVYALYDPESNQFDELKLTVELMESMQKGRYKVLAVPSEATQTQRIAMATELMKVSQTTPDPIERGIYVKKAFKLSDMRGFDELQEEVDTAKQLQNQVAQLQAQVERDTELMKQWENRVINSELKLKIAEATNKAVDNINTAKAETEKDIEIEKLKEQLKDAKKPKESK